MRDLWFESIFPRRLGEKLRRPLAFRRSHVCYGRDPNSSRFPSTVMRDMKRSETAPPRGNRNLFRRSFEYREAIGIIADPGYGGDYGA